MSNSISEMTPRQQRKPVRLRKESVGGDDKGSSTSDSSPWEERAKPIPIPRKIIVNNNNIVGTQIRFILDIFISKAHYFKIYFSFHRNPKCSDYVNLLDYVSIRDDKNIYSDIVKTNEPPALPNHKPRQWEAKLYQAAAECLSISDCVDVPSSSASPYHVTRMSSIRTDSPSSRRSGSSKLSAHSSPRVISAASNSPMTPEGHYAVKDLSRTARASVDAEYYIPPDAARLSGDIRTSLVPSCEAKNISKEEDSLMRIPITDIVSVSKISQQGSSFAFQVRYILANKLFQLFILILQLVTSSCKYQFMTESERTTHEWVTLLNSAIKGATLRDLATRRAPVDASISGWLTRARCGHSKKIFAALVAHKLMFFKNIDDMVPSGIVCLLGARISDKNKGSSDEYSGSSDEQQGTNRSDPKKDVYSLCIEMINEDPLYLVLRCEEEKEKWLYFLRSASGDTSLYGSPFEVLVQRMLAESGQPDSQLWEDTLLTYCDNNPSNTLTTINDSDKKKALEIAKACFLFVSVLMRPSAVQYHIDLAQNILSTVIQHDFLKNELYAQLIKLTNGFMPYGLQAALERSLRMGGREEGPSRLEATSVLTRDITATKFPHSISVKLPNGQYQAITVVEFDGSTEIGQCLSSLCLKLGIRPALLSGYALYIDDPSKKGLQLLKGKQKLCDCLCQWEHRQRDFQRGRIADDCASTLSLRMRHYWKHLLSYGDAPLTISDEQFEFITRRFYPTKMFDVACIKSLRSSILCHWSELNGMAELDATRIILQVLRQWPLFGCHLEVAGIRTSNDRKVFLALSDTAVYVLDHRHFDVIRVFPYHRLTSFGGFHNDFMLTAERILPPEAHPEETTKERVTFSMEKDAVEQLTLHLAEYIRCQRLVWKMSK
uniref:PH domain-containing protein n=1 Tax=Heterorhabditis bacteriophora TaxID=37862 RepID=A0A1I7XL24_HETBA